MKHFVLAICLLAALSCAKPPAPQPVQAPSPVLPQFKPLAELYDEFQGFRGDQLYLRHGFTANFPKSDWLTRVQAFEQEPELAAPSRLLAGLAIAHRLHGAQSVVTQDFEARFAASIRPTVPRELQDAPRQEPIQAVRSGITTTPSPEDAQHPDLQSPAPTMAEIPVPAQLPPETVKPLPTGEAAPHLPLPSAPSLEDSPLPTQQPAETVEPSAGDSLPHAPLQSASSVDDTPLPTQQPAETVAPSAEEALPHAPLPSAPGVEDTSIPSPQPDEADKPDAVTLLFSGDTQGVVYPQPGLSGPVGGIDRRGPVVERLRAENPNVVLVDAGDTFISGSARAEKINKILVRAMNLMGYDAMGLGHHDLAMGEIALRELVSIASFPLVCTNLMFSQGVTPWIRDHVMVERGGMRVAIISLLSTDTPIRVTGARLMPPSQALAAFLPRLQGNADCVILLTQIDGPQISSLQGLLAGITAVIGDFRAPSMESPRYLPTVPKGLGISLLRLERSDLGTVHPVLSMPLLSGNAQDPRLVRMLEGLKH
jgi:hypothetical protein